MSINKKELVDQAFFNLKELGGRWRCHPLTADRRMKRLGIHPVKLSKRALLYRKIDVERIEALCLT